MVNYAIVDASNHVANVIVWNGLGSWAPPVGCVAVLIPAESPAAIGWKYIDGVFHAPVIDPSEVTSAPKPLTPVEKLAAAGLTVDELKALLGL